MDFIDNVLKRMDLQQVCAFLLEGKESPNVESGGYERRLEKGRGAIYKRLEDICKDKDELDEALGDLAEAFAAYEAVYSEIGARFGAKMIFQLLKDPPPHN